ncbi:DUF6954 family protein [Anaerotalea alkaliphila]|uniref:Uncharacterized protein n=1 Tax=Anaerotalea alkaliphila TaxID=2662126 RepID=A0A7X5HTQ0_9FIRM|nr:hypothetical protein [Anaerotalea alkaliphila]NDL66478.1 hypothetical protein [Anaerotalea alkaliphila]
MKQFVAGLLFFAVGSLLGFFGVFVSVFADGGTAERLATIAVLLLLHGLGGFLGGFLFPRHAWLWGLLLAAPGVLLLGLYLQNEPNPLYVLYMALLLLWAVGGNQSGARLGQRRKDLRP